MVSKRVRIAVPVLALALVLAPLVVHNVFGVMYSLKPTPTRVLETSVGSTPAVDLILNISQASLATTYQFTWVVTDPSGGMKNHANQTVATAASFLISLQYPRDFGTMLNLAGNYSVAIDQNMPAGATNPVAIGQFQVGLTDKIAYQRTNTVTIKASGYANTEPVTINIFQTATSVSAPGYPTQITADTSGNFATSWQIPVNVPLGLWTVTLTGKTTNKAAPDTQNFNIYPINVTLSPLTIGQTPIQRTQTQSVLFTANYLGGSVIQTGTAKVRFTQPGSQSYTSTAIYNSTLAAFQAKYVIAAASPTGGWVATIDINQFNDSYSNTGPAVAIAKSYTVWPTNVTIPQLAVSQNILQRSQTELFSFSASYLNGVHVQTGWATIKVTETDGTTFFTTIATYNSTSGLYQVSSRIPSNAQTGAWVASIDPGSFNDSYGNGGPLTSVVRAFTVQSATIAIVLSVENQTFTVGQVMPIYAKITYPDGSMVTNGTVTVNFRAGNNQTGSPITLTYVQGLSRWAGSYIVKPTDISGLWVATLNATDPYGNAGRQTQSVVVSVPGGQSPPSNTSSLDLFWFLVAAMVIGSGSSGLLLIRRFNSIPASFDRMNTLMGGELSPSSSLMILGDVGSGTTTLSLELVYRHLASGKPAGMLAYDAFPQEILRNMRSFGWDVSAQIKSGSFKILDCYSALAGVENPMIRDPVDFTEISIRVSQMMEGSGTGPYMLVLDSIAPVFNGVHAQMAINFLRVLSAKIKNNNGILIITGARGAIPETVRPTVDNIVDGEIELQKLSEGKRIMRTLTVRRLAGRSTSPVPAEFEIVTGKGIVFRKLRIPLRILMPKRKTRQF